MVIKSNVFSCALCVFMYVQVKEQKVLSGLLLDDGAKTHDKDLKKCFCDYHVADYQLNCSRTKTTTN